MGRISLPAGGGLSDEELTALATDAELASAVADKVTAAQVPVKLNGTSDAIIPQDNNDSWIVGSDRMDRHTSDATMNVRAFFNKAKGAFRSGRTGTTGPAQWDDANLGTDSFATGLNTQASGLQSFAQGESTTATGQRASAFGGYTAATATSSHAEGSSTTASGIASHAEGSSGTASGTSSHAEGLSGFASGAQAHVEGDSCWATGINSHAQGKGSYAVAHAADATGIASSASRLGQHAQASGKFTNIGDAQYGQLVLRNRSIDATPVVLTSAESYVTAPVLTNTGTNVLTIGINRAYTLRLTTVARCENLQGEMAGFTWEGLVGRDSTGNARIIGTPIEAAWGDSPATDTWTLGVSIDTTDATNNYVKLTATGEAAKQIRWVTTAAWTEVAS